MAHAAKKKVKLLYASNPCSVVRKASVALAMIDFSYFDEDEAVCCCAL
jgi:hypothetical protein